MMTVLVCVLVNESSETLIMSVLSIVYIYLILFMEIHGTIRERLSIQVAACYFSSILWFLVFEMTTDPLFPSLWVTELLWNFHFLEELRCSNWS